MISVVVCCVNVSSLVVVGFSSYLIVSGVRLGVSLCMVILKLVIRMNCFRFVVLCVVLC